MNSYQAQHFPPVPAPFAKQNFGSRCLDTNVHKDQCAAPKRQRRNQTPSSCAQEAEKQPHGAACGLGGVLHTALFFN